MDTRVPCACVRALAARRSPEVALRALVVRWLAAVRFVRLESNRIELKRRTRQHNGTSKMDLRANCAPTGGSFVGPTKASLGSQDKFDFGQVMARRLANQI